MAQHPYYYTINDDNGLPSNEVYDLEQDEFGYMWVGCDAGLFRYDGFKFDQYKNASQNAVAISSLTFGRDKKLYSQNFFGQIFYAANDSLVVFADVKEKIKSHPEYTIDRNDNAWIGLPTGILKYNSDGSREHLFNNDLAVVEIAAAPDGNVYVLDNAGTLSLIAEPEKGKYTRTIIPDPEGFLKNSRYTIKSNSGRLFLLSTHNTTHIHYISEITGHSIKKIRKIESGAIAEFIYTISLIGSKLWLGTSEGAYVMNEEGAIEAHYFPKDKISDILIDREGTYWFSSLQNGIFVIPHLDLTFVNTGNSALRDNNITALKGVSASEILTGTYTGDIYRFYPWPARLEPLPRSPKAIYRNVTSIIPVDNKTIIAGRGGISVINTQTQTDADYSAVYIRDMAMVGDSIIYVSTQSISSIVNIKQLISGGVYNTRILKAVSGKKISYDKTEGTLWVTLNEGLAKLEGSNFTLFKINEKPVFCNALYNDANGLWAGTVSDGVYNIRNGKVALHLGSANGLSGNNIKCITSQGDTLYVATDECINIRYPNGTFSYIRHADGINAKEINALCIIGGYIYIGTIRGMFYVPVNTRFENTVRPNIRIISVFTDGQKQAFLKKIWLAYNNKDILINFSATALRSRGRFYYLYRINGFQNEWKRLDGSVSNLRLNHLPAGNFDFEIKAVNEDNVSSPNVARLSMVVAAPFWQHWLFYVLLVLVASSLVTMLFILRIRNIKRKADIRDQLTNSQLTALKAQMNPHFMYNTLNSIQDFVLQSDIKNTNYYLSRYSTLMRKILDTSDSVEIELTEETEILQLYLELEQLRFGSDFAFSIDVAPNIDKSAVHIPSMIIQPFVENAIKHGLLHKKGRKQLDIVFAQNGNVLKCSITDNGVGRAKAQEIKQRSPMQHKSFATKATEKRLSLINQGREYKILLTINDLHNDGIPAGTEVVLEIPLGHVPVMNSKRPFMT